MRIALIVLGVAMIILATSGTAIAGDGNKDLASDELYVLTANAIQTGAVNAYAPDEIIVRFRAQAAEDEIGSINARNGASVGYASQAAGFKVLKIPKSKTVEEMVEIYSKNPNVEYAEPNYIATALMAPNDPYYIYQWHLKDSGNGGIGMEEAWDISTGSGVTVAIVDTGIRAGTDLSGTCFVSGYDFVNNDNDPTDDNGHGTHVAGTVAQRTDNGLGVAGVAYGACLMPVKVLNSQGSGTYSGIANGIMWAADHGANVISMSLGGPYPSTTLEDALEYAYSKGVTIVAAAGNDGIATISYPAAYDDYVIAVGATRYDKTLAYYSNYGPSLDLVAPGGDVNVDQNGDGYGDGVLQQTFQKTGRSITWGYYFFQGTSMATPHVSGVAAILISAGVADTPDEVRAALQETAIDLGLSGRDDLYGYGLVNAPVALAYTGEEPVCTDMDGDTYCEETNDCNDNDASINPGAAEVCNNVDDNCDGTVDQITMQCGTTDVGACSFGTETCTDGDWGACEGSVEPTTEVCNGIDDDCDGALPSDEADADSDGYMVCELDCDDNNDAINPGATEICDQIDNNCNLAIDEGGVCDITEVPCWSAGYLYRSPDNARKFCKCAMGDYGYSRYSYIRSFGQVYVYQDTGDNDIWELSPVYSSSKVYQVRCTDGQWYYTNHDYSR